jgi:acetoin utilization deacetylase AcuC-like enzyme
VFRIRRIPDDSLPGDRRDIARAQQILRERLPGIPAAEIDTLPERLRDPVGHQFRSILLAADDLRGRLLGFALLLHEPEVGFCFLDYLVSGRNTLGGVGGALYERVRANAKELGARALFYECPPDDADATSSPELAKANAARLKFYERYGARPIVGTDYERPVKPGDRDLPHLVHDGLDRDEPLRAEFVRAVVRTILERKYAKLCPPEYVEAVLASIVEDPVRMREPRYARRAPKTLKASVVVDAKIALFVNEDHDIHHVRERGYVEAPVRIASLLAGLLPTGMFVRQPPRTHGREPILAVHDPKMVGYLSEVCRQMPAGKSIYPYVFPPRNRERLPKDLTYAAGYYCLDTFTPLNANAYAAACGAVDCALSGADSLLDGHPFAYAMVRPPGHHAERSTFGGFCYFNNAAVAAHRLSQLGRVAILDVDYHHGNGQQDIFFERADVLTVSIHGDPEIAYPFYSGFADEIGVGDGRGFNLNLPLPEQVDGAAYLHALDRALVRIQEFAPRFLVVALGLDTAKHDPTGTWSLRSADFEANGRRIGALRLPTLVVQEGGYRTTALGQHARAFFLGLVGGASGAA